MPELLTGTFYASFCPPGFTLAGLGLTPLALVPRGSRHRLRLLQRGFSIQHLRPKPAGPTDYLL